RQFHQSSQAFGDIPPGSNSLHFTAGLANRKASAQAVHFTCVGPASSIAFEISHSARYSE
ncbi:MAG TPA: hypothetical protein VIM62_07695, partial [Acidobacteriaceae bacterium]